MLFHYNTLTENVKRFIEDDPVRPHIPYYMRCNRNRYIAGYGDPSTPRAIVCYTLMDFIPVRECELFYDTNNNYNVVCLYTIWSYEKGCGRKLVEEMRHYIKGRDPFINRLVTLSPRTEMARNFHISNGAHMLRDNEQEGTVNYEYIF